MPADIEQLLAESLAARAGDVAPDPRTWRTVQARIRRNRIFRWSLAGAAAASAVMVAAALPTVIDAARVEFEPAAPATAPAPEPSPRQPPTEAEGRPAPVGCPADDPLVLVGSGADADLHGQCRSGGLAQISSTPRKRESDPVVSPDGTEVAFTRHSHSDDGEGNGKVVLRTLADGRESVLGAGYDPAFSPDGRIAWLVDEPGDGEQPHIVVRQDPTGDPFLEFPVFMEAPEEFSARHLVWDSGGRRLWWEAGYEGTGLWTADLTSEGPAPQPVAVSGGSQGSSHVAPSAAGPDQAVVLALCCVETEGDMPVDAEVGVVTLTGEPVEGRETAAAAAYTAIGALNELPSALRLDRPLFTAAAGALDARGDGGGEVVTGDGQDTWRAGDTPAWLVGDATSTYLVDRDGGLRSVPLDWTLVTVNPAFAPVAEDEPVIQDEPVSEEEPVQGAATATVQVYFGERGGSPDCEFASAHERDVPSPAVARGALTELLEGPTAAERRRGAASVFSQETAGMLNRVEVADGVAHADFGNLFDVIGTDVGASCAALGLLSQLDNTLMQFPEVEETVYSIDGDVDAFYLPLGMAPPDDRVSLPEPVQQARDRLLAAGEFARESGDYGEIASLIPEDGFFCSGRREDCVKRWQREERQGGDPLGVLIDVLRREPRRDEDVPGLWHWPADTDHGVGVGIDGDGTWRSFVSGEDCQAC